MHPFLHTTLVHDIHLERRQRLTADASVRRTLRRLGGSVARPRGREPDVGPSVRPAAPVTLVTVGAASCAAAAPGASGTAAVGAARVA